MKQNRLTFILIAILLLLILSFGGYILIEKYWAKPVANLVNSSQNGLPGKLLGPITNFKAKTLDPNVILKWTNQYRVENNQPVLKMNDLLTQAAQKKTDDMFQKQYFEHVSPDGIKPADVVVSTGYSYAVTGENLALGDFNNEKDLVDAWMNSPGHRANILSSDYTEIGIAADLNTFEDRGKTWLAVQEFGRPAANCAKPDADTLAKINASSATYEGLINQITTLSTEASNLNKQANEKIQKGNDIYIQTSDKAQAQPYWDEGLALQEQADLKTDKSKDLQTQAENLHKTIQTDSTNYNNQVKIYNTCIKS